jgi:uncharacterized protein (DUF1330 family)
MSAYVIIDVQIKNPEKYEQVKKLTPPTVTKFGGKYLARGGKTLCLAGEWDPSRLVLLEFSDLDQVQEWLNSPEYNSVKALRDECADVTIVATEALVQQPVGS